MQYDQRLDPKVAARLGWSGDRWLVGKRERTLLRQPLAVEVDFCILKGGNEKKGGNNSYKNEMKINHKVMSIFPILQYDV